MSTYRLTAARRAPVSKDYKAYHGRNLREIPQISRLSRELIEEIEVVSQVFPVKVNNYVLDHLIHWDEAPDDPMFRVVFPRREMLSCDDYDTVAAALAQGTDAVQMRQIVDAIRARLHPGSGGRRDFDVPSLDEPPLPGMQHKYRETVLFFPSQGQTCHAYCSFCFRWTQFVGPGTSRFAARETGQLIAWLRAHPEVSDVLYTGGDPLVMSARTLASYLLPVVGAGLPHVQRIRIGTKALGFWPYRFVSDPDAPELLALFRRIVRGGHHLALMAHFNHPRELETDVVQEALAHLRETGVEVRTQAPLLRGINDDASTWAELWRAQVNHGCVPYYMFLARDIGAQPCFAVPLVEAATIYRDAFRQVSGLSRTVRGPSMSAAPGKVEIVGVPTIHGEQVIALRFLQARTPEWVMQPFFARYDADATWLDDLQPAFGARRFFFEHTEPLVRRAV
ncbi:MAG: lysine 2,3-aminomutase [Gammaproteobacteria bacterium]|nr:lysine 2,3-aminomutase [Gammaproteobacteria bacterium]